MSNPYRLHRVGHLYLIGDTYCLVSKNPDDSWEVDISMEYQPWLVAVGLAGISFRRRRDAVAAAITVLEQESSDAPPRRTPPPALKRVTAGEYISPCGQYTIRSAAFRNGRKGWMINGPGNFCELDRTLEDCSWSIMYASRSAS